MHYQFYKNAPIVSDSHRPVDKIVQLRSLSIQGSTFNRRQCYLLSSTYLFLYVSLRETHTRETLSQLCWQNGTTMYTFNSYLTRSKVVHQTSCITGQVHQTSCIYLVCTLFSDLLEGSTFALGWVLIVFNLRTHLGISSCSVVVHLHWVDCLSGSSSRDPVSAVWLWWPFLSYWSRLFSFPWKCFQTKGPYGNGINV